MGWVLQHLFIKLLSVPVKIAHSWLFSTYNSTLKEFPIFKSKQGMGKANWRSKLARGGLALLSQGHPGAEGP